MAIRERVARRDPIAHSFHPLFQKMWKVVYRGWRASSLERKGQVDVRRPMGGL
jgi:hypothetical protein